jgi:hypothetical protein
MCVHQAEIERRDRNRAENLIRRKANRAEKHVRLTRLRAEKSAQWKVLEKQRDDAREEAERLQKELHDACEAAVEPNAALLRMRRTLEDLASYPWTFETVKVKVEGALGPSSPRQSEEK